MSPRELRRQDSEAGKDDEPTGPWIRNGKNAGRQYDEPDKTNRDAIRKIETRTAGNTRAPLRPAGLCLVDTRLGFAKKGQVGIVDGRVDLFGSQLPSPVSVDRARLAPQATEILGAPGLSRLVRNRTRYIGQIDHRTLEPGAIYFRPYSGDAEKTRLRTRSDPTTSGPRSRRQPSGICSISWPKSQ